MAYGYMRAADALAAGLYGKYNDKLFDELRNTSDEITKLRKAIWDAEFDANCIDRNPQPDSELQPSLSPDTVLWVRSQKKSLKQLVLHRRDLGGAVPQECENWWK